MSVLQTPTPARTLSRSQSFELSSYCFVAPDVFDQARPRRASIKKSSTRFDRVFGGQREMRFGPTRGMVHQLAPLYTDGEIRASHPFDDELAGLGFFLETLALADMSPGVHPQISVGGTRLIAYLRSASIKRLQVAEAIRAGDGFELDVFDLDEASPWDDASTFILDVRAL